MDVFSKEFVFTRCAEFVEPVLQNVLGQLHEGVSSDTTKFVQVLNILLPLIN